MFDIGMSELLLIGIVALIVVGPKDLPGLFHSLGRFTAKLRSLGREFSRAMNDAARDSGMDDVAGDLKKFSSPKKFGLDRLSDAADKFESWDPSKPGSGSAKPPERGRVDPDRAADVEKIRAATEKAGQEKLDRDAAAKAHERAAKTTPAKTTPAKTTPAKTTPAKTTAAKKAPAKRATAKKAPAKKTAPGKAAPRKAAPRESTSAPSTARTTGAAPAKTAKAPRARKPAAETPASGGTKAEE